MKRRAWRRWLGVLGVIAALVSPVTLDAKGGGKGSGAKTTHATKAPKAPKAPKSSANRDSHGNIKRSEAAKHAFEAQTGYPHGRPGYVVDHIKPLACGGVDAPSNMQWQTIAAATAKDKVERAGCR